MGISIERAQEHVAKYTEELRRFPKNANWPRNLFFACHITSAVAILQSGRLLPRGQQDLLIHDVANQGAVANNPEALGFTRLYFRPKNDFHIRTEGIKCLGDPYRLDRQMSVPIMLAMDATQILSLEETGFTFGKYALVENKPGFDQEFFENIPFADVYHDYAPPRERMNEIHDRRMAEVVYPGPLEIDPYLNVIICRSNLDRLSLLHALGPDADRYSERVVVEQLEGSIFMRWGLFIRQANLDGDDLLLHLSAPRASPPSGRYEVAIRQSVDGQVVFECVGSVSSDTVCIRVVGFTPVEQGELEVHLEEVLAYRGPTPTGGSALV